MFPYNIWMTCLKLLFINWIQSLTLCILAHIYPLICASYNFLCSKVRFIHTSTVTASHSCPGKNYAYVSRTSCIIYRIVFRFRTRLLSLEINFCQRYLEVHCSDSSQTLSEYGVDHR